MWIGVDGSAQPISFFEVDSLNGKEIEHLIVQGLKCLYELCPQATVHYLVCDGGSHGRAMARRYRVDEKGAVFIEHPYTKHKIYFLPDSSHVIK